MSEDGRCPVCRLAVDSAAEDYSDLVDSIFAEEDAASGVVPLAVSEPSRTAVSGPYLHASRKETGKYDVGEVPHGLLWVLFSFRGRIPRRVFWSVEVLRDLSIQPFAVLFVRVFGQGSLASHAALTGLFGLSLWILLAVDVKRWHDLEKSAWWVLIRFVPIVGWIWIFIELGCLRGTGAWNAYGPSWDFRNSASSRSNPPDRIGNRHQVLGSKFSSSR